jgi:glycosyltransferase involved in cell wall biosynthesis
MGSDDELIVQDGGSTDGSADILRDLSSRDPRVKFESAPDDGQSDALNRGLARATGDWIVWLNADDVLLDNALDSSRDALSKTGEMTAVLTGNHEILRASGDRVDTYRGYPIETETLLKRSTCASFSGSVIVRRSFLCGIGGFDNSLACTMDYALQLRIAQETPEQIAIGTPIGALRFHDTSKSANLWKTFLRESLVLRMRYADTPRRRALAFRGLGEQALSFMFFRVRLMPGYRKVRRAIRG